MNRKLFSMLFVFLCFFAIAGPMENHMRSSLANRFEIRKRSFENGGYKWISGGEMGKCEEAMEKIGKLEECTSPESVKILYAKSSAKVSTKNKKVYISIELGNQAETFSAEIQTKKDGHKVNQVSIKIEKPYAQSIKINVNKKGLEITHSKQKEKSGSKNKDQQMSLSNLYHTLDQKLNLEKTEIEYDKGSGILSIIIPEMKILKKPIKSIEVAVINSSQSSELNDREIPLNMPNLPSDAVNFNP